MKWEFVLTGGLISVTLKAEVIYTSYQIEEIKVTGDGISIIVQSNRPLLLAIERNIPITWKLLGGTMKDPSVLGRITAELERGLFTKSAAEDFPASKKTA